MAAGFTFADFKCIHENLVKKCVSVFPPAVLREFVNVQRFLIAGGGVNNCGCKTGLQL